MPTTWKNLSVNSFPPETEDETSLADTLTATMWGHKKRIQLSCSQIPDPQKLWDKKHVYYHKVCSNFITQLQKRSTVPSAFPIYLLLLSWYNPSCFGAVSTGIIHLPNTFLIPVTHNDTSQWDSSIVLSSFPHTSTPTSGNYKSILYISKGFFFFFFSNSFHTWYSHIIQYSFFLYLTYFTHSTLVSEVLSSTLPPFHLIFTCLHIYQNVPIPVPLLVSIATEINYHKLTGLRQQIYYHIVLHIFCKKYKMDCTGIKLRLQQGYIPF